MATPEQRAECEFEAYTIGEGEFGYMYRDILEKAESCVGIEVDPFWLLCRLKDHNPTVQSNREGMLRSMEQPDWTKLLQFLRG